MKILILPFLLLSSIFSFAQVCTPGAVTSPNSAYILPDSATNFDDACVGIPYVQYVYIKAPKDTTVSVGGLSIPATIDSFVVNKTIGNLPAGLMVETVPTFTPAAAGNPKTNFDRLIIKGDSLACIKISGTPTGPVNIYNLTINVRAYLTVGGALPQDTAMDVNYYKINVKASGCAPAAVSNLEKYNFNLIGNSPNPFNGNTTIAFESAKIENYELKIVNAMGTIVYSQKIRSLIGMNYVNINATNFAKGMYMMILSNDKNRLSQKMYVQ